ncbi:hypothetical protein V495_06624 [Pseudogymnoascus sp. VKM F-4514 (FW-929)]|nr:hypothetical protein V495_06624 [Pseudogymnoascus sp. VKM F-4514 (FW-929)]KFY51625.1 hypothetical protein V497_08983 [Pseudogymnoascus sp. VKM F-4516 (FW-969)]
MAPATKGIGAAPKVDGSDLRIGIVHARWNEQIIEPLLEGARKELLAAGVKPANIVVQSVPGSWELPIAVRGMYTASQIQATQSSTSSAGDLLGSTSDLASDAQATHTPPFDALIAIGVLIKGETMHFEYISDAVSTGLMRVQLDAGIPLIFGLLTVLSEEQALVRAGLGGGEKGAKGYAAHNHGEDWGKAAVELGQRRREWGEGKIL